VSDAEILTLPTEFEGLPEQVRSAAFDRAEAMLPANILAHLGQARAEQVLVEATCHVLTVTGAGTGEPKTGAVIGWKGSPYGSIVEQELGLMPKPTGRTRATPISSGEA
jgi:hypothetical protein